MKLSRKKLPGNSTVSFGKENKVMDLSQIRALPDGYPVLDFTGTVKHIFDIQEHSQYGFSQNFVLTEGSREIIVWRALDKRESAFPEKAIGTEVTLRAWKHEKHGWIGLKVHDYTPKAGQNMGKLTRVLKMSKTGKVDGAPANNTSSERPANAQPASSERPASTQETELTPEALAGLVKSTVGLLKLIYDETKRVFAPASKSHVPPSSVQRLAVTVFLSLMDNYSSGYKKGIPAHLAKVAWHLKREQEHEQTAENLPSSERPEEEPPPEEPIPDYYEEPPSDYTGHDEIPY